MKNKINLKHQQQKAQNRGAPTLQVPNGGQQQGGMMSSIDEATSQPTFYLNQENAGSVTNAVQLQVPVLGAGQPSQQSNNQRTGVADAKTPFLRDLGANYHSMGSSEHLAVGNRHGFEISFKEIKSAATTNVLFSFFKLSINP